MTVGPKAEDHVQHGPSNYFVLEETNGVVAYATGGTDARAQRSLISDLLLQTEITYSSTVGGELLTDIGWFRSAVPFAPARARSILESTVTGGDVPADASAVVLNVPVTGTQQPGFVTAWPCGSPMPTASNLNFGTQDTVPNAVIGKVVPKAKSASTPTPRLTSLSLETASFLRTLRTNRSSPLDSSTAVDREPSMAEMRALHCAPKVR